MKKLSLIFLSFLCVCSLHAESIGLSALIKLDMNQMMRDYCTQIRQMGCELVGEIEEAVLYQGTVLGVEEVDVIVYGTPDKRHVGSLILRFPPGKHWAGSSDYEALRNVFVDAYGKPHMEENKKGERESMWRFDDLIIAVSYEDNMVSLMLINNHVIDEIETSTDEPKPKTDNEEPDENSELYCQVALRVATEEWENSGRTDNDYLLMMAYYSEKLGGMYFDKGWFTTAANYYKQTIEYAAQLFGKNSVEYISNVHTLAITYMNMGDMQHAGTCVREVLERCPSATFEDQKLYFIFLRGALSYYEMVGNYVEAEAIFDRMMNEMHRLSGDEYNKRLLMTLHDRYTLALEMGHRQEAKTWLDREGEVLQRVYTEPHLQYGLWYGGYGVLYLAEKNYTEAENLLQRALRNLVDLTEHDKRLYEVAINNNLSIAYAYGGKTDEAVRYAQKVVDEYRELYTADHPKYANALTNLAFAYSKKKDYVKALEYSQEAVKIFEAALGPEHDALMTSFYNVASYNALLGNFNEAERMYRKSIGLAKKCYQRALNYMSEHQREQFWHTYSTLIEEEGMSKFIYYHYANRPTIPDFAYDNELFSKGLLLASTEMVRRSIEESGDQALIARYEQLSRLKERIYFMELSGKASHELDSCRQVADALEKEVTRQSAAFRQNADIWTVTWKDVQAALRPHQLAIEFTRIPLSEDSAMYAALLLRSGDAHPRMVPLFEEKEVTAILQTTDPDTQYDFSKGGWILFRPIWSKLLQYMHYGDTVYCAATGVLHQIAIENLPFNAEQTIGALFQIERVSSTRELVHAHHAEQPHSAVLYGGIYYDMDMDDLLAQSESYSDLAFASTRAVTDESLRAGVHYLPGTRYEVEMIRAILRPSALDTRVYTTSSANEESFKALSGQKKNILHVATHGFYWTDSTAREQRYFAQRMAQTGTSSATIDPLTRSGLLFAGSNIALRGHSDELPQSVQDGILTSKEISLLDLRGSEMVVLSACETGKGEVTGDGVFGLQRAFKMAGAQSILMSLWPVDDAATQLMMTEFYYYWIDRKMTKREAFLKAQASVKQQYTQPKYWAAFILLD